MKRYLSLFLSLFVMSSCYADIVIYTSHRYPVNEPPPHIQVVYIDAQEKLEDEIFNNLSAVSDIAEEQAKEIINSPEWEEYEKQLIELSNGMLKAWELKLKKIPAIVFNEKYVVYGTTDIEYAENRLRRYLNEK